MDSRESDNTEDRKRPKKLILGLVIGPILAMTIAANIAAAFFPALVDEHPAWLIVFDARARNMLLTTVSVGIVAWFVIGMIRRTIFHPLYFLLGRWYGEAAVRWISQKSPDIGRLLETIEKWFPRFGPVIVALYAHPLVCVLAGASQMGMIPFVIYNIVGNAIELAIIWQLGDVLESPIKAITNFISRYTLPLTIASFTLVFLLSMRRQEQGSSPIESIDQIEEELEELEGLEGLKEPKESNRDDKHPR